MCPRSRTQRERSEPPCPVGSPRNLYESLGIPRGSRGPGGSGRTPGMRNAPSLWIHKDSGEILGQGGGTASYPALTIKVAHYQCRSLLMSLVINVDGVKTREIRYLAISY